MNISPNIFKWTWWGYVDFLKNLHTHTTSVFWSVTGDSNRKGCVPLKVLSPPQLYSQLGFKFGSVALKRKRGLNFWVQFPGTSQSLDSSSWDSLRDCLRFWNTTKWAFPIPEKRHFTVANHTIYIQTLFILEKATGH